jgi:lysozyme
MRHSTYNGLKLIKQFEGFSSKIYLDAVGFPTIGYGHLIKPHEKHLYKNGISELDAESILKQDVQVVESAVARFIKTPLTNNQFDALASFTFNVGIGALQRSTLRAKVNRQEHEQVPAEFLRWVYADGKKLSGLIRRRRIESELYVSIIT